MNRYILLLLLSLFVNVTKIHSQTTPATVQPKIIVIPYTKEGEDLRTILEEDINKRITLAKIREAFDNRGFTTIDFIARLKAISQNNVFIADNQTDLKSQLIEMSGADIYVEAEINVLMSATGNSVKVIVIHRCIIS